MKKLPILLLFAASILTLTVFAQKTKTDANIVGHVISADGSHLPFATVTVKGTTIGTTTDETGHYQLINLPQGKLILQATYMGFKPQEIEITINTKEVKEVNFKLEEDQLGLDEIVITGDRNEKNRVESSVIVNTLSPKLYTTTQSVTLSEGLNFCPGLRTENNCQNCGFTQVRINGMEGQYSQVLINNRPIFSGLAGVYGLELIPVSMIERVEVVRGGGSALYGSNAIAGTINLILKDPINSSYEFGINGGLTGIGSVYSDPATDLNVTMNGSIISGDNKTGMSLYGFYRSRQPFDANEDSFSELPLLQNTTIGSRVFHRFGSRSKITADFFNIHEKRRGGNKFDDSPHMADIAESVQHNILTGSIIFDRFFRSMDLFSVYASAQYILRDSYYGARQSLNGYGKTWDITYNFGAQYTAILKNSSLIMGVEETGGRLKDKKLGYPDEQAAYLDEDSVLIIPDVGPRLIADQTVNTLGAFLQYEIEFYHFTVSAGLRYDNYIIKDRSKNADDQTGNVLSPRITVKYDIQQYLQARLSYSHGYRAPQIFDEDLHTETSGARQVIHVNAPDLEEERSHSLMASLDFNKRIGRVNLGLLVEGYYTRLNNAFSNQIGDIDENGIVVYTRVNAEGGAVVKGINLELFFVPSVKFYVKSGFTFSSSQYLAAQEFDEKRFLWTPNDYGYITFDWQPWKSLGLSASGNYTGRMLVPYFGEQIPDPEEGELRESKPFFDAAFKIRYDLKINGATFRVYAGIKNIFNAYQDDFDTGIDRDPGYIYGPSSPRMLYLGLRVGNLLH